MIEAGTPRIISFLHDCLAEDRSSSGVPSIFASKIRARRFLAGSDNPLAESTGIIDLPPSQAAPLIRDAALYRRERELLHGSLPRRLAGTAGRPAPTPRHRVPLPVPQSGRRPPRCPRFTTRPGPDLATLRSQLLLRRAALPLLPLSISEWSSDPGRCMATLFELTPPPLP